MYFSRLWESCEVCQGSAFWVVGNRFLTMHPHGQCMCACAHTYMGQSHPCVMHALQSYPIRTLSVWLHWSLVPPPPEALTLTRLLLGRGGSAYGLEGGDVICGPPSCVSTHSQVRDRFSWILRCIQASLCFSLKSLASASHCLTLRTGEPPLHGQPLGTRQSAAVMHGSERWTEVENASLKLQQTKNICTYRRLSNFI